MAYSTQIFSKTDFKIAGHYCFIDANGKWISNPPLDTSDTNLVQACGEVIKSLKRV